MIWVLYKSHFVTIIDCNASQLTILFCFAPNTTSWFSNFQALNFVALTNSLTLANDALLIGHYALIIYWNLQPLWPALNLKLTINESVKLVFIPSQAVILTLMAEMPLKAKLALPFLFQTLRPYLPKPCMRLASSLFLKDVKVGIDFGHLQARQNLSSDCSHRGVACKLTTTNFCAHFCK